jgi:hypothetical protein
VQYDQKEKRVTLELWILDQVRDDTTKKALSGFYYFKLGFLLGRNALLKGRCGTSRKVELK